MAWTSTYGECEPKGQPVGRTPETEPDGALGDGKGKWRLVVTSRLPRKTGQPYDDFRTPLSCRKRAGGASLAIRRPSIGMGSVILLDANVVTELMRKSPDPAVEAWIAGHPAEDLFFSAVGEAELRYDAAILVSGRRPDTLSSDIDRRAAFGVQ